MTLIGLRTFLFDLVVQLMLKSAFLSSHTCISDVNSKMTRGFDRAIAISEGFSKER